MSSNERSRQNCIQWLRLQQEENAFRLPIQETDDVPSNLHVTEFGHTIEYPNHHSTDRGCSFPHISDRSNEITTHYARISYARSVNDTPSNASQEFYEHEINITTTQPKTFDINVDFNRTNAHEKLRRRKNAHHKYLKDNHKMMQNAISPTIQSEEVEMPFINKPSVIPQGGDGIKLFCRSNTDHDIKSSKKLSAKQERVNLGNSKIRSKSMNAISSNNSKLNKPELVNKGKNKFYDPEDAKNFIKEQKKKWRANLIGGDKNAAKLQKEIIKKRLEELNTNSRQIISKNLKKKEKLKVTNNKNAASISKNNIETKLNENTSKKTSEDKQKDVENFESVQNPDCVTEILNIKKIKVESGNINLKENEEFNLIGTLKSSTNTSNLMKNVKTDTQCIHEVKVLSAKLESVDSRSIDQKLTDKEHKQSDEKAVASSSPKNNNILSDYPLSLKELQENICLENNVETNVQVITNEKEQTNQINVENLFNSKQPESQLKSSKIDMSSTALLENQKHLGLLRRQEENNYLEKMVKDYNINKENVVQEISESITNIEPNCKGFSSILKKDEEFAVKEMLKSSTIKISSGNSRLKDNLNLQKVNENEKNDLTERCHFTKLLPTSQKNFINFDNHVMQPIQYKDSNTILQEFGRNSTNKISTQIPTDISLGESHFQESSQNSFKKNERSEYCKLTEDKNNDFSDSSCSIIYSSMPSQRVYGVCNTPLNKIDEDQLKKPFKKEYLPNTISNENVKNDIIKAITDAIAPIATQLKEYKAATQNNCPNANELHFENCSNKTDVINEHEFKNKNKLLKQSYEHNNIKQYNCGSETSVLSIENTLETKSLSSMKSSVSSSLVQSSKKVEDTASNLLKYLLQPGNSEPRPYNFIVAVRQKLNATTQPNQMITQNNTTQTIQHQQTSTTDLHKNKLTNDSVTNNATKKPKKHQRPIFFDDKLRDSNDKLDSLDTFSNSCSSAKKIQTSTIKSFQSGSTENILNSSKCKTTYDGDDTTVSSSLLSSPKNQHAPLKLNQGYFLSDSKSLCSSKKVENMENAGELNIPKNVIEILPYINNTTEVHENSMVFIPNKQKNTRMLNKKTVKKKIKDLKSVQMPKNEPENHKFQPSETQISLKKLLYDFNHSLSQVIEFNEKFKNTIDKSHEILSPKHSFSQSKSNLKYSTNFDCPYVNSLESPVKNLDLLSLNESEQASNSKHSPNLNFYRQTQETVESCSTSGTATKNEQLQKTNTTFQSDSQCNKFPKKLNLRSISTQKCIKVENKKVMLFDQLDKKSKLSKKTDLTNSNIDFIKTHINNKRGDFFSNKDEKEFLLNRRLENSTKNSPIENDNCIESSSTTATSISNNDKRVTNCDNGIIRSFDTKHTIKEECGTQTAIKTKKSKFLETKASRTYEKAEIAGKDSGTIEISNKVEYELSMLPSHCSSEVSEAPLNCSNLELYEKLINNETIRTEQLATLLKMREKALINRTKGQIAWLEVQKKQFKAKALQSQIAAIKKKQRGILIKMEKEREEIKRLIHSTTSSTDLKFFINQSGCSSQISIQGLLQVNEKKSFTTGLKQTSPESVPDLFSELKTPQIEDPQNKAVANTHSTPILRSNYNLESSRSLEEVLKKRENDIQKRREQVERLMQWHQRLDQEEAQILELEDMLFKYNNTNTNFNENDNFELKQHFSQRKIAKEKIQNSSNSLSVSMENRLKEIDRSLRELSSITTTNSSIANTSVTNDKNVSTSCTSDTTIDYIRTTGSKLNKLWRRLTTQKIEKFDSSRRYKLRKKDLERLYENAKIAVLQDFTQDERIAGELLDKSSYYFCKNKITYNQNEAVNKILSSKESLYSLPEISECKCNEKVLFCKRCEDKKIFDNFFIFSQQSNNHSVGLQRSLSDTQISVFPKVMSEKKCQLLCQCNLVESSSAQKKFSENRIDEKQITTVVSDERLNNGLSLSCHEANLCSDIEDLNISSIQELSDSFSECESNNDVQSSLKAESNLLLENTTEVQKYKNIDIHFEKNGTKLNDDDYIQNNKTLSNFFNKKNLLNGNSTNKSEKNLVDPTETMTQKSISLKNSSDSNDIKTNRNSEKNIENITQSDELNLVNNCNFDKNLISKIVQTQDVENTLKNSNTYDTNPNFEFQTNENTTKLPIFLQSSESSKENTLSIEDKNVEQSKEEKITLDSYEDDFEDEESQIEDMSLPHFENTIETTQEEIESENLISKVKSETKSHSLGNTIDNREEQKSLLLQNTISQPPTTPKVSATITSGTTFNAVQQMPDIINEVEKSCYQHIIIENEQLKQFDQIPTVPYMYVREIPNKPPPPYVPPAHGSPMTTIFPSEERIKDITYRFSHEMYCKMFKTEYTNDKGEKLPSVMEEKITNIYERIILDICREYLTENQEILNQSNPINFYSQLAFFNPPDRLRCIQESIYKEVRRCLAMDKLSQKSTQIFSIYGNRANRDHIGKIIMQEMSDEDGKWCNFHREENEVLNLIVEEMIVNKVKDLCKEVFIEEGGTIETEIKESSNEVKTENDLAVVSEEPASRSFKIDEITPCVYSSDIDNSNAVPLDSKIDTTAISSS